MKTTRRSILGLMLALPLVSACGATSESSPAHLEAAESISNGKQLNGKQLNGILLNGMLLNGMLLNGTMINGKLLNGKMLNGMLLNGMLLNGKLLNSSLLDQLGPDALAEIVDVADQLGAVARNGATLGGARISHIDVGAGGLHARVNGDAIDGADFIGARLTGFTGIGMPVPLRIDDAHLDAPGSDIMLYDVSYAIGAQWYPLCGLDPDGNRMSAVAVPGRWNLWQGVPNGGDRIDDGSSFTLGCVEDAIGKCVRLGYEPWAKRSVCSGDHCQQVDLSDWHQACTRMVRADYCGDGVSHTVDGTMINVYDGLGIQIDDEPWFFEAEWDAGGARCVTHQRVVDMTTVPGCAAKLIDPTCGSLSHFGSGTLLMDEYEIAPTSH